MRCDYTQALGGFPGAEAVQMLYLSCGDAWHLLALCSTQAGRKFPMWKWF